MSFPTVFNFIIKVTKQSNLSFMAKQYGLWTNPFSPPFLGNAKKDYLNQLRDGVCKKHASELLSKILNKEVVDIIMKRIKVGHSYNIKLNENNGWQLLIREIGKEDENNVR